MFEEENFHAAARMLLKREGVLDPRILFLPDWFTGWSPFCATVCLAQGGKSSSHQALLEEMVRFLSDTIVCERDGDPSRTTTKISSNFVARANLAYRAVLKRLLISRGSGSRAPLGKTLVSRAEAAVGQSAPEPVCAVEKMARDAEVKAGRPAFMQKNLDLIDKFEEQEQARMNVLTTTSRLSKMDHDNAPDGTTTNRMDHTSADSRKSSEQSSQAKSNSKRNTGTASSTKTKNTTTTTKKAPGWRTEAAASLWAANAEYVAQILLQMDLAWHKVHVEAKKESGLSDHCSEEDEDDNYFDDDEQSFSSGRTMLSMRTYSRSDFIRDDDYYLRPATRNFLYEGVMASLEEKGVVPLDIEQYYTSKSSSSSKSNKPAPAEVSVVDDERVMLVHTGLWQIASYQLWQDLKHLFPNADAPVDVVLQRHPPFADQGSLRLLISRTVFTNSKIMKKLKYDIYYPEYVVLVDLDVTTHSNDFV
ncbi:unnamed protein product, partial [Amoebophrya sp. A25]|eukprot:GSA25T00015464001.1